MGKSIQFRSRDSVLLFESSDRFNMVDVSTHLIRGSLGSNLVRASKYVLNGYDQHDSLVLTRQDVQRLFNFLVCFRRDLVEFSTTLSCYSEGPFCNFYLSCNCNLLAHTIRFSCLDGKELYVDYPLNRHHSLLGRIWLSTRFLLSEKQATDGHWDCTIIDVLTATRLIQFLNAFLRHEHGAEPTPSDPEVGFRTFEQEKGDIE